MRHAVVALLLVGCGGETVDPLVASFPLGPRQAALALTERFPGDVDVAGGFWKGPARDVDVVAVRSAVLELGERGSALAERDVRPWPATVSTDLADSPFLKIELLVGPADSTGVHDPRVVAVADGEVPRRTSDLSRLVWRDGGSDAFTRALTGRLEGQDGKLSVALFVRATASLTMTKGARLPDPDGEATVIVDVPLRSFP